MVDAIREVLSPEEIVERQIDGADLRAADPGQDVVDGVVGEYRHPVVFLYSQGRQGVGGPVALPLQLSVGQGLVPVNERRFVRVMIGAPADHVGDDPPVHLVVTVHQEFQVFLVDYLVARLFFFRKRCPVCCHISPPVFSKAFRLYNYICQKTVQKTGTVLFSLFFLPLHGGG